MLATKLIYFTLFYINSWVMRRYRYFYSPFHFQPPQGISTLAIRFSDRKSLVLGLSHLWLPRILIHPRVGHTRHPPRCQFVACFTPRSLEPAVSLPFPVAEKSDSVMENCVVVVPAAFMHVRDNLEELGKVADDTDLLFLKGLLDSPVVTSLVKVSEQWCASTVTSSCL